MSELLIDFSTMKIRILQCLVLLTALAFTACPTTDPKKNSKKAAKTAEHPTSEENADVDFQAFVGRLRKAVKAHDVNTIAAMMTPGFAYVLGATPAEDRQGAGVFQYWDENGLWTGARTDPSERFVQRKVTWSCRRSSGPGGRLHRLSRRHPAENGSWKFVYFVNG